MEDSRHQKRGAFSEFSLNLLEGFETLMTSTLRLDLRQCADAAGQKYYDDAMPWQKMLADDGFAIITGRRSGRYGRCQ